MLPDLLLAVMLIGMAWAALSSNDLRRSVVLFIAFGLSGQDCMLRIWPWPKRL